MTTLGEDASNAALTRAARERLEMNDPREQPLVTYAAAQRRLATARLMYRLTVTTTALAGLIGLGLAVTHKEPVAGMVLWASAGALVGVVLGYALCAPGVGLLRRRLEPELPMVDGRVVDAYVASHDWHLRALVASAHSSTTAAAAKTSMVETLMGRVEDETNELATGHGSVGAVLGCAADLEVVAQDVLDLAATGTNEGAS